MTKIILDKQGLKIVNLERKRCADRQDSQLDWQNSSRCHTARLFFILIWSLIYTLFIQFLFCT